MYITLSEVWRSHGGDVVTTQNNDIVIHQPASDKNNGHFD
jgi:hypothetical protein